MKRSPHASPTVLVATLLVNCAIFLFGFPLVLSQFANYKIEIPSPTILAISLSNLLTWHLGAISFGVLLLALVLALASGEKFAWWFGFALTIIFGAGLLTLIMPIFALTNPLIKPTVGVETLLQIPLIFAFAIAPPLIFLALRRKFWGVRIPRSQTLRA